MKILIAGGAGYIGSYLIPLLLEKEHEIEVVDLLWFGNSLPKNVKIRKKDIMDLTVEDLRGFNPSYFYGRTFK